MRCIVRTMLSQGVRLSIRLSIRLSQSHIAEWLCCVYSREQMTAKFKECDVDNNGLVSLSEAKNVLLKPPFNFPEEKVCSTDIIVDQC